MMVGGGDFGSRLLHITLGSLWRGNFLGRGSSSEEVVRGNLPVNSNLLKCYYMLDLDAGGGGEFIRWVSQRRADLFIPYFGV